MLRSVEQPANVLRRREDYVKQKTEPFLEQLGAVVHVKTSALYKSLRSSVFVWLVGLTSWKRVVLIALSAFAPSLVV